MNDTNNIDREGVWLDEKLFASALLFEEQIDCNHWVLFNPAHQGWPVVIQKETLRILEKFNNGEKVSNVLNDTTRPTNTLANILFLKKHGFLKKEGAFLPYCLQDEYAFDPPKM